MIPYVTKAFYYIKLHHTRRRRMPTAEARSPWTRILLGPGPSNVHPRVLQALTRLLVGHLDPVFLRLMDETKVLLRFVFHTQNTLPLPHHAGKVSRGGASNVLLVPRAREDLLHQHGYRCVTCAGVAAAEAVYAATCRQGSQCPRTSESPASRTWYALGADAPPVCQRLSRSCPYPVLRR